MKTTLKKLIKSSSVPASLIRAVVRQMGGWETFTNYAPDITRHGISGGFNGFIYYADTLPFAKRNRADIAKMAEMQAEDFGTSALDMVRSFGCFRQSPPDFASISTALYGGRAQEDTDTVLNALAWYAAEEVARAYCDLVESES